MTQDNIPGSYRQDELTCPCCRAVLEFDEETEELIQLHTRDLEANQRRGLGSLTVEHHGDLRHLSYQHETPSKAPEKRVSMVAMDSPLRNPQARRADAVMDAQQTDEDAQALMDAHQKNLLNIGVNPNPNPTTSETRNQ